MPEHGGPLVRLWRVARELVAGAAGLDAYEHYLAHHRRRHAGETPLSREQFFRRELDARWEGVRRCC